MTWFSILLGAFYLEETLASKVQIKTRASEAKKKVSEQTSLLTSANQPTAYDSTSSTERNTDSNGTQPSENTAPHHHPTQSASHERPPFSRPLRKRSRRSLAHVQSWTSGYTPTHSRDSSPAAAPSGRKQRPASSAGVERTDLHDSTTFDDDEGEEKDEGIIGLLKIAHIRRIMLSYAFLSLTSVSLDSVQVLYFVSSRERDSHALASARC
jgi:hypothetical protein